MIRTLRRRKYKLEGKTEREIRCLENQVTHTQYSDLSKREKTTLEQEMEAMWQTIPPEYLDRANKLSGRNVN